VREREGLPLTVARRPPGWWVGRAHNRVRPKKYCDPKVGGRAVTWVPVMVPSFSLLVTPCSL
jgi:hypothetical protein